MRAAIGGAPVALVWLLCAPLPVALVTAAGCEATPEKIQRWKETEKGPAKLRDTLRSDGTSAELRAQALTALVELGMVSDAQEDAKDIKEAQRAEIVHGAVPPLIALAQATDKKAAATPDATTRVMREAKDALFAFRDAATPADRALIDDALIQWVCVDLAGRMTAGAHSTEQILLAIGPRAGPRLAQALGDDAITEESRLIAARLLGKLGDRAVREQAGARLVERARADKKLQESTLQALGLVGGDHAVAFLTTLAENPHQSEEIRQKALFSLAQGSDPASLPTALRLAGDGKTPGEIREAGFQLAEKIGPASVTGLVKLFDDKDEKVRWRAVEATVAAGKLQAIAPVLEGLSPARTYKREDIKSFVVHDVTLLGPAALPALREELASKSWVARVAAAWALSEFGKPEDAARLEALGSDGTRIKGWAANATVGTEARAFAAGMRAKK